MAGTSGNQPDHLIQQMTQQPGRFDFNQAVRLIYRIAKAAGESGTASQPGRLGTDASPADEPVRFHTHPSSRFPAASVHSISRADRPEGAGRFDMSVLFSGLTGPNGVLPRHFTSLLVEQRRENNLALEQFQDLFNHRLISLFYRAWEKHRFPVAIEQARLMGEHNADPFTRCLLALVGLGQDHTRGRHAFDDSAVLYFAGQYARRVGTAVGVRDTLAEYFGVRVKLEQFVGQWVRLDPSDRSAFGSAAQPLGQNMALGVNTVVGESIWYAQGRFRVHLGPMNYKRYRGFLPDQKAMQKLCELVRLQVGPEYEFDVVPILLANEVPTCQLGGDDAPRLGWTTFLATTPRETDFDGARFERPDI